jgi:hypothetical protein
MNQFRLLKNKEFLNISVSLHTAFPDEAHLAEGQWLEEQVNMLKLRILAVGTRKPNISRREVNIYCHQIIIIIITITTTQL